MLLLKVLGRATPGKPGDLVMFSTTGKNTMLQMMCDLGQVSPGIQSPANGNATAFTAWANSYSKSPNPALLPTLETLMENPPSQRLIQHLRF